MVRPMLAVGVLLVLAVAPLAAQTGKKSPPPTTADSGTTPSSSGTPSTALTEDEKAAAAAAGVGGLVCVGVLVLLGIVLTFIPIVIAAMRHHPNTAAIAAVTILTGWTGIGWIIALVWSLTAVDRRGRYG